MGTRWHYSGQHKTDGPINSRELRRLAAEGKIRQTDLVRRSGSKRWIPAAKVEGLFAGNTPEWYYTWQGRQFGPVTFRWLWNQARAGLIQPDDLIWKPGMERWKRAAKIVGAFPASRSPSVPRDAASDRRDRPRVPGRPAPRGAGGGMFPWEHPASADVPGGPDDPGDCGPPEDLEREWSRIEWPSLPRPGRDIRGQLTRRFRTLGSDLDRRFRALGTDLDRRFRALWTDLDRRFPRHFASRRLATIAGVIAIVIVIMMTTMGAFLRNRRPTSVPAATTHATPEASVRRPEGPGTPIRVARIDPGRPRFQPPPMTGIGTGTEPATQATRGDEDTAARRRRPEIAPSAIDPADNALSPEDERRIGREVHELIVARHKVLRQGAESLRQRLSDTAAPLLAHRLRGGPPPTFTILDSDGVFTFSHPGGYLYVSRGLFNFVRNDVELQFILGVEIAHLDLRHLEHAALRAAREESARGEAPPDPARRLYRQIALGYTEDQVFEADAWSYRALRRLGRPWYRSFTWLSPLYDFNGEDDPRGSRRVPETSPSADRQDVEGHWLTNPSAATRYNRLRGLVEASNS